MWTAKKPQNKHARSKLSEWELEEHEERMRHAVWLVRHGASVISVSEETGIPYETLRQRVRRYELDLAKGEEM